MSAENKLARLRERTEAVRRQLAKVPRHDAPLTPAEESLVDLVDDLAEIVGEALTIVETSAKESGL